MRHWAPYVIGVSIVTFIILFIISFDSLEYQEIGLNYSWLSETVEEKPYESGRYYLGVSNHFIRFPKMVTSVFFIDDPNEGLQGPALQSRTRDGLNVRLEVSFQYRLFFDQLYKLYTTLGADYEKTFIRMAIEQLTTAATLHNAHFFFTNRTEVSTEMQNMLDRHFRAHAFAEIPFFQLRTVHLPAEFEDAIKETQVKQQEIQIAALEQKTNRVGYQTTVLQAEQAVKVLSNQAAAEASSILAQNEAYCTQYKVTQELQSEALSKMVEASGWSPKQLLDYLRIRAVRDHPSDKTTISL